MGRYKDDTTYEMEFEKIFKQYWEKSCRFIEKFVKSKSLAEDLAQNVFLRLWYSKDTLDSIQSIDGYIFRCCRNASLDYLRSIRNTVSLPLSTSIEGDMHADSEYIARERELILRLAVAKMPERRRKVFSMSRFDHLSNDEIATELGISKKTVENHISTALHELRKVSKIIGIFSPFLWV